MTTLAAVGAVAVAAALLVVLLVRESRWARRVDELTARADAERANHRRVEARLVRALDAIPQGVVVVDGDGEEIVANTAGSMYSAARHGDALVEAAMGKMLARALQGETCGDTVELVGPPRRVLVITAMPLEVRVEPGAAGPGAVAVIDDVTERRRLEAIRRDFVANISHELKTPIGALALLAETLAGEDDLAVTSRLAERIFLEAHRVGRTIDDLLELSRIEVEEAERTELVPVSDVLGAAVDRMRAIADQKGITLQVSAASRHLTVLGDRRQLVSAVFNLLENAVKYSDEGSTVQARATSHGTMVDISVSDHGVGIPAGDLERVFERFYRVDQARSRQTGGTGLGLAIVRHVVNNHRGEVLIESVEGEGSTFTLRFPAGEGPVPLPSSEAS